MKKTTLLLFILFLFNASYSQNKETTRLLESIEGKWKQDEKKYITYQEIVEIPNISKDILFSRAENYFAYTYKDANSVIQVNNKESGTLIGKGIFPDVYSKGGLILTIVSVKHILKIECKENKVRVTLSLTDYDIKIVSTQGTEHSSNAIYKYYPIDKKGMAKNNYGQAFYYSHKTAIQTIDEIVKSLKGDSLENNNDDW